MFQMKSIVTFILTEVQKEDTIADLRQLFLSIDTDGSGKVSVAELQELYEKNKLPFDDFELLVESID